MLKIFSLSLVITCALCAVPKPFPRGPLLPHKKVDVGPNFKPKIIQGEDANEGQFPYMVSLNWEGDGHACGASVITSKWILTAAHCCLTGSPMYVYSGSIFLSGDGQSHPIAQYVVNGDYDPDHNWRNDVCLVEIQDEFQFNDRLQQVTLPPQGWPHNDGDKVLIQGWGYTDPNENVIPDRLQVGYDFIALSNDHCGQITGVDMFDGYICATGNHQGQGVCQGDSGSPLMKDGVQIGVTSWVYLPCGSGLPDFYARVPNYINWIQQVLGKDAVNLKFAKL